MKFIEKEEDSKFSDFAVHLIAGEEPESGAKSKGGGKSSGYPSKKLKGFWHSLKTAVAIIMLSSFRMIPKLVQRDQIVDSLLGIGILVGYSFTTVIYFSHG